MFPIAMKGTKGPSTGFNCPVKKANNGVRAEVNSAKGSPQIYAVSTSTAFTIEPTNTWLIFGNILPKD